MGIFQRKCKRMSLECDTTGAVYIDSEKLVWNDGMK